MQDINNMNLKDFDNLFKFIDRRNRIKTHKPVPLRDSDREMIKAFKDRNIGVNYGE